MYCKIKFCSSEQGAVAFNLEIFERNRLLDYLRNIQLYGCAGFDFTKTAVKPLTTSIISAFFRPRTPLLLNFFELSRCLITAELMRDRFFPSRRFGDAYLKKNGRSKEA